MAKINNNEESIIDLMNFSPYGLEAEKENEANGKVSIVSQSAWIGVAEDINKRMDEFYSRKF